MKRDFLGALFLLASWPGLAICSDSAVSELSEHVKIGPSRHLYLHCVGTGAPTVVLDAGLWDSGKVWGEVQKGISQFTRVCAYDRAGLGKSDPSGRPSSAANIVDDLHN